MYSCLQRPKYMYSCLQRPKYMYSCYKGQNTCIAVTKAKIHVLFVSMFYHPDNNHFFSQIRIFPGLNKVQAFKCSFMLNSTEHEIYCA